MFIRHLSGISLVAALVLLGLALFPSGSTQAGSPPEPRTGDVLTPADKPPAPAGLVGDPLGASLTFLGPAYTGCGGATAPITNAAYEQQVVELVNAQRLANGSLPPYKSVDALDDAARYHAVDMAQDDYFDHNSYDRNNQKTLVWVCSWSSRVGTFYSGVYGENIAAGYPDPTSVMNGWMNSSGHRANILSGAWEIGVGYYLGGSWGSYWVQDFGRRTDVYPLVINREAAQTTSRSVALYIYGSGIFDQMRLKNENGSFGAWQPFQTELPWTLSACNGSKTVTAELKNPGTTITSSDSILLAANPNLVLGGLPDTLHFIYSIPEDRLAPSAGIFIPKNIGDGSMMPYTVSSVGDWFTLSATSGNTPVSFTLTPADFDSTVPGSYTGSLTVTSSGVCGSPHTTSLSLVIVDEPIYSTYLPIMAR